MTKNNKTVFSFTRNNIFNIGVFIYKIKNVIKRNLFSVPQARLCSNGQQVCIPRVQISLANGCNLKCYGCSHLNPLRKGIIPADEIQYWCNTWKTKIVPNQVDLLGGEPFLNKDIANIITRVFAKTDISKGHASNVQMAKEGLQYLKVATRDT
jgi:uncharacterized radical SAM superfamily Fe-S cluster-containing enzyme